MATKKTANAPFPSIDRCWGTDMLRFGEQVEVWNLEVQRSMRFQSRCRRVALIGRSRLTLVTSHAAKEGSETRVMRGEASAWMFERTKEGVGLVQGIDGTGAIEGGISW